MKKGCRFWFHDSGPSKSGNVRPNASVKPPRSGAAATMRVRLKRFFGHRSGNYLAHLEVWRQAIDVGYAKKVLMIELCQVIRDTDTRELLNGNR